MISIDNNVASVCLLSATLCIVAKMVRPRAKVTTDTDSLYEVVCKESIVTKMNNLDLCLEVA